MHICLNVIIGYFIRGQRIASVKGRGNRQGLSIII